MKKEEMKEATKFEYYLYSSLLKYQSNGVDFDFEMPDGKIVSNSAISEVFGKISFEASIGDVFGEQK